VRRYSGEGKYAVENLRTAGRVLVIADDYSEADGHTVLSFGQAQERAKAQRPGARKPTKPYTVADAMDAYLAWLESEGRSVAAIADARYRDRAFVRPKLGEVEVASLTADKLRHWRDGLARAAPRLRTRAGRSKSTGTWPTTTKAAARAGHQ
jgi:hypothetical protein